MAARHWAGQYAAPFLAPPIASKSNRLEGVPTNAVSSCLRSMTVVHDPDDLFSSAQAAEQAGDIAEAERLYSMLMKSNDPSAAFNLGNMLRACGRNVEAEAALQAATRVDPAFAEAWYNLSDLLDEQGRSEAAIECLRKSAAGRT